MIRHLAIFTVLTSVASTAAAIAQTAPLAATITSVNAPSADTTMGSAHASGPALREEHFRYRLHRGDTIDIAFPFTPEFNQSVTVQPDGYISLTSVGTVHVENKTVPELAELIRTNYAAILREPVVNIVLKDFEKPYFIANGALAKPGKYELRSDTTLTEAVAIAGGFTEDSKHSEVFLFRRVAGNWVELKRLDVKEMYKKADLSEDLHLQPGDMVFVPQNRYSKFKRYIPSPGIGIMASY